MATQNISQIPAPRVPLVDVQTNTVSREWFMWFNNIYSVTGTGTGVTPVINGGTGLGIIPTNGQLLIGNGTGYTLNTLTAGTGIVITNGSGTISVASTSTAPVTKTADFTVAVTDSWIINNKAGSTCVVTLPTPTSYSGRELNFQNYQAQALVSASSNVVPRGGGVAGTSILLNVAGNWATLVSDGTNWIIMQAAANNCLLLE
jgi:hypothetical protein